MILNCLTKTQNRTRAGISLTEAVIVLSVIGAVLAGLWTMADTVRDHARKEDMVSQMVQTVTNIRDVYNSKSQTGISNLTSFLIESGAITSGLVRTRVKPYTAAHMWDNDPNGDSFIVRASSVDRSGYFEIVIDSLDRAICIDLAGAITGDGGPQGLVKSKINSSAVTSGAVSPEIAAMRCNLVTGNRLIFSYLLRAKTY